MKKIVSIVIGFLIVSFVLALSSTVNNLYGESDPFNITVENEALNYSSFVGIPNYAFIKNMTFTIENNNYFSPYNVSLSIQVQDECLGCGGGDVGSSNMTIFWVNYTRNGINYLYDDFEDGVVDTTKWEFNATQGFYREQGGYLEISSYAVVTGNGKIDAIMLQRFYNRSYDTNITYMFNLKKYDVGGASHAYYNAQYWNLSIAQGSLFLTEMGNTEFNTTITISYLKNGSIYAYNYTDNQETTLGGAVDTRIGYTQNITDLHIYENQTLLYSRADDLPPKSNASLYTLPLNNILSAGCPGRSIISGECLFNLTFDNKFRGILEINIENITYTYLTNLSVNITNRITGAKINKLVNIRVLNYDNYTTTTGTLYKTGLEILPNTYEILAESEGYVTEKQVIEYIHQDSIDLNFYLINGSEEGTGLVIVQVYDDFYNLITGADVRMLQYEEDSDSFVQVTQCFTDTNGECVFNIQLDNFFYIFTASKEIDGKMYYAQSTETGQQIKIDQTIIELHLKTSEGFELPEDFDLVITPSNTELTGNTSYLTATFIDYANYNHTVCIGYYVKSGLNEIVQDTNCITAASGIVNYADGYLLDRDFTYIAKIYTQDANMTRVYNQYTYNAIEGTLESEWGIFLKPFILFLLVSLLAVALYLKNIIVFAIGAIPLSFFTIVWVPNLMGGVTISFIILLCITVIYLGSKKTEVLE